MEKTYFIIDFDSTFVQVETLELLAEIALGKNPKKDLILEKIRQITEQGMTGKIPYEEELRERLKLFKASRTDIEKLVKVLKRKVTPSILRNKEFFKRYKEQIYIISGGFKEYMDPLFKQFGIDKSHIIANNFMFDRKDYITGFDQRNPLTRAGGKPKQIKKLNLKGKIFVIGDGYTDYEIKKEGLADKFFVFHENIKRESVSQKADYVLPNFDEFLYIMDMPRAYSYPKSKIKVLLLEQIDKLAQDLFKREGYQVQTLDNSLSEEELEKVLPEISILGIRSRTKISGEILSHASRLLTIGAFCIGTDKIDLKSANKAGVAVFNAPFSNTRSVVELVLANLISLSRGTFGKNSKMHQGIWDKKAADSHEIRGKRLGIVGYGNIGSQLSVIAQNLGMDVFFYDIKEKLAIGTAKKCNSLKELLKISDVVSVHVDGNSNNKRLIGEKEFSFMKDGVLFINTSRGFVVDLDALASNIKKRKIKGAAIDVFDNEPKENGPGFISPLRGLPNVVLTPHIGGSTEEAQRDIAEFVSGKIMNYINTGNTTLSVNFPNLQLPPLSNAHRFIHIHRNVPGVLAQINNILAQNNINILGQYLGTNEEIGYVITDVNKKYSENVIAEMKHIEATIKFRVLY